MPTVATNLNRQPPQPFAQVIRATVADASPVAPAPVIVALDGVNAGSTAAKRLTGQVLVNGDRVLILLTDIGNYVLGTLA